MGFDELRNTHPEWSGGLCVVCVCVCVFAFVYLSLCLCVAVCQSLSVFSSVCCFSLSRSPLDDFFVVAVIFTCVCICVSVRP